MKQSIQISTLIVFTWLVVFTSVSDADVRISLKNGRTIIADSCRDVGARLVCEKLGGSFEIEKKDVLNQSEVKKAPHYYQQTESTAPESNSPEGGEQAVSSQTEKGPSKEMRSEEAKNRLTRITARKKELQAERERLQQERKQLEQDMKNSPEQLTQSKFEELNRRNAELEEKIKRFNAEVQTLDQEEKNITGERTDSR